jgi:nucleoid DNA-binding protein
METRLTTWDAAVQLAAKAGIAPQVAKAVLQAQAELAYQHAATGYPIAGIGILSKVERPARKLKLMFGPRKGEEVILPAKQVLKLHIAKVAKDIVFKRGAIAPDVTKVDLVIDDETPDDKE